MCQDKSTTVMKLVTIKIFEFPHDAELLKATLENEGIPCALFDTEIVGLNPLYSNAVGGIKLKVNESDQARAIQVLEMLDQNQYERAGITCPNCGSNKVEPRKNFKGVKGILSLLVAIYFVVFPIYQHRSYFCKDCGAKFNG